MEGFEGEEQVDASETVWEVGVMIPVLTGASRKS